MKVKLILLSLVLALALALGACAPAAPPASTVAPDAPAGAGETTGAASAAITAAGDAAAETAAPEPAGIDVVDMADRRIVLEAPATRVVAVMPSDVEIMFAVGAGDYLVGRGAFADYPAEAAGIAEVASGSELNAEQIIALEPELVLLTTMSQSVEQLDQLEQAGITVAVSDAQDIEGVYQAIALIGALTGKDDDAAAVIADMKTRFADVKARAERIPAADKGTVYFEVSPLEFGLWTAGSDTFMDEITRLLGAENAFADISGWAEVSEEQILARDPDAIVTIAMYFGEGPTPEEAIVSRDGWSELKAVKAGRVFLANADELSRPGPRLADGAEALFAFLYPDAP